MGGSRCGRGPGGACGTIEGIRKDALEELVVDFVLTRQWSPELRDAPLDLQQEYVRTFIDDLEVDMETGDIRAQYYVEGDPREHESPLIGYFSPTGSRTPVSWLRTTRPDH